MYDQIHCNNLNYACVRNQVAITVAQKPSPCYLSVVSLFGRVEPALARLSCGTHLARALALLGFRQVPPPDATPPPVGTRHMMLRRFATCRETSTVVVWLSPNSQRSEQGRLLCPTTRIVWREVLSFSLSVYSHALWSIMELARPRFQGCLTD